MHHTIVGVCPLLQYNVLPLESNIRGALMSGVMLMEKKYNKGALMFFFSLNPRIFISSKR